MTPYTPNCNYPKYWAQLVLLLLLMAPGTTQEEALGIPSAITVEETLAIAYCPSPVHSTWPAAVQHAATHPSGVCLA